MPAGSGPRVATAAALALTTTAETVVCTVPGNWNNTNQLGNLLSAFAVVTTTGAVNLTLTIRQGTGTGGAVVGSPVVQPFAGAVATFPVGNEQADVSAFGNLQQGGTYTLTATASAANAATLVTALLELETVAPV